MSDLGALLLAFGAVALLSIPARLTRIGAAAAAVGTAAACAGAHGPVRGVVIGALLAMTAASVLVLVLPPRPQAALPLGTTAGLTGACLVLSSWLA